MGTMVKKYKTDDVAFRLIDGKFYINSQEISPKNIVATVQITIDLGSSVVIVTTSSQESEIMVKGKLNYDALQKFEV